jgi:hypothetical protein
MREIDFALPRSASSEIALLRADVCTLSSIDEVLLAQSTALRARPPDQKGGAQAPQNAAPAHLDLKHGS